MCFLSILHFTTLHRRQKTQVLGHVLRMEQKRIPKKGLRWNPPSKRKQGRPKTTLRKTFEGDLKRMKLTWGTAEREAKERRSWRKRSSCIILNGQTHSKKKILGRIFIILDLLSSQKKNKYRISRKRYYIFPSKKRHFFLLGLLLCAEMVRLG